MMIVIFNRFRFSDLIKSTFMPFMALAVQIGIWLGWIVDQAAGWSTMHSSRMAARATLALNSDEDLRRFVVKSLQDLGALTP